MSSAATQETASTDPIPASPKAPKARSLGRRPLQRGVRRRSLTPESRCSARPATKSPAANHDWTSKAIDPKPSWRSARSRRRTTAGDARRWSAGSALCFRFGILREPRSWVDGDGEEAGRRHCRSEALVELEVARRSARWVSEGDGDSSYSEEALLSLYVHFEAGADRRQTPRRSRSTVWTSEANCLLDVFSRSLALRVVVLSTAKKRQVPQRRLTAYEFSGDAGDSVDRPDSGEPKTSEGEIATAASAATRG